MFVAICNETFGMSPEEVLESDFVLLSSVLRERSFINLQRSKEFNNTDKDETPEQEYTTVYDFKTGQMKRVPKVKAI